MATNHLRTLALSSVVAAACASDPAAFARRNELVEACRMARSAETDQEDKRELVDELLRQAKLRVNLRPVSRDALEAWLGHPVSPRYSTDAVTTDLDLRLDPVPFDVSLQRYDFDMIDASPAFGPSYLSLLDVPPMPHEQRVRIQGRDVVDFTKSVQAIVGHAATGGVGIMLWWALGGQARDLIPKAELRREAPLSDAEKHDIEEWATRRDVQAVAREIGFRMQSAPPTASPPGEPIAGGTQRTFRAAFFTHPTTPLPRSGKPDTLTIDLRFSVRDPSLPKERCELGIAHINLPLSPRESGAAAPRRLPVVVQELAARGWVNVLHEKP